MESVRGRLVVMVGIGLVGGILVIQILKAEGILSPKKSSISSSVLNNVVERGDTSALLDNKQREWPEGLKEEVNAAEEMGEKDDDTNIITGKDTNTYHKLLHILKGIAPQKTEAGKGETAAHEKRFVRVKREHVMKDRQRYSFDHGGIINIRHPRKKLHHRNFDLLFSELAKEEEEEEEREAREIESRHDAKYREVKDTKNQTKIQAVNKSTSDSHEPKYILFRAAILTGRDVTMVATSPVKTKMRGWDLQMPVVIALVLLLGISLISLVNLCCCCFHPTKAEGKEVKDEKPVLLL